MNNKNEVTAFVEKVFDRYLMPKINYFYEVDCENGEPYDVPLFSDEKSDEETVGRISRYLGLSSEEILNMDEEASKRYWRKYPFFKLYRKYRQSWYWQAKFSNYLSSTERVLHCIFDDGVVKTPEARYDYKAITHRLKEKLKEIDMVVPGTYHENARITNLSIETEVFVSFPEASEMLKSFIEIIDAVKALFFKGLREELSDKEILEYNFLVSWLDATDITMPSTLVTYDNLLIYRKVYVEENHKSFFSYVKIKNFVWTSPWRCKEFFDDEALVRIFFEIFPQAKQQLRQFSMDVSKFTCHFVWSDAKPIMYSPQEELEMAYVEDALGFEPIPYEERAKEPTRIYLEKTSDEMFDWQVYAEKLNVLASPSSMGGIELPKMELHGNKLRSIERLHQRIAAKNTGVTCDE